jgi:prepilin-type N-terminal cleavage/methylation domain-containing protein
LRNTPPTSTSPDRGSGERSGIARRVVAGLRLCVAAEAGFTLIEVLVGTALVALVAGAIMTPMVTSARVQNNDANYAYSQQQARTGLDAMVAQIRQAWSLTSPDPNQVDMNVFINGSLQRVFYECDVPQPGSTIYHECVRLQVSAGNSLPALSTGTVAIKNLTNGTGADPVFTFAPDPVAPYYMTATVKVPASGATNSSLNHSIVFSDGALMRNQNVGQ